MSETPERLNGVSDAELVAKAQGLVANQFADGIEVVKGARPDDLAARRDAALVDFDLDSLDLVEVGMIVEEHLGVVVRLEQLEGLETLGEVLDVYVAAVVARARRRG